MPRPPWRLVFEVLPQKPRGSHGGDDQAASATMAAVADIAALADLLRETEEHHGPYEASAPKHHWSDWYAAYISARQDGYSPDEAARDAGIYVEGRAGQAPGP